jgi:hypothetical protein
MRRSAAALVWALIVLATSAFAPSRATAAGTPKVFLLGDSVMAGLNFSSAALALLQGAYDVTLDAKVCRALREPSCSTRFDGQPPAALTVMRGDAGQLGDVLVMMTGYNDGSIDAGLDAVMAEANAQDVPHVLWLTYRNPTGRYSNANATLVAKTAEYPTLTVADWDSYGAGHGDWFAGDGLHLTAAGAMGLATFLKANIDAVLSGAGGGTTARCRGEVTGSPATPTAGTPRVGPAGGFVSVAPTRVADTRTGAPLGAGRALDIDLSTVVSPSATAVVVNVTAVDACGPGYATAYACGTDVPVASNVNYERGTTRANLALVVLGQDRHLCVYSYATTDLVVDVSGWLATDQGWRYEPLTPSRLIDTRDAQGALSNATGRRAAGSTTVVTVTPWPGAPMAPAAVLVNVTAVNADGPGFVTVSACDGGPPAVSNLNVDKNHVVANLAATAVAGDGTICVYTSTAMDIVVDLEGWFGSTGVLLAPQTPQRIVDTRVGLGGGRLVAGGTLTMPAPTGAIVNVTATNEAAPGYVTVYPCGPTPWVSNANYGTGETVPALAAVGAGGAGSCITSLAASDIVVDRLATLVG